MAVKTPTQGRAMSVRRKAPGMPPGRLSKGLPDKSTKERSSGEENSRLYPLCRGYWSEGGKCRIRVYREDGHDPVVMCSQLPTNENTSATNMAEYLAAEVIGEYSLPVPLLWIEHYPEHEGGIGEYSQVRFSSWDHEGVCPGACDATLPAHPACL